MSEIFLELGKYQLNVLEVELFTLISFKELIIETFELKLDFIIARVSNLENEVSNNSYSYYCAYNFNRILFKYDLKERMLHRMIALNPSNNLYIVGGVDYFKITYDINILNKILLKTKTNNKNNKIITVLNENSIIIKSKFLCTDTDFLKNKQHRDYFRKNFRNDGLPFLFEIEKQPVDFISFSRNNISNENIQNMGFYIRLLHFNFLVVFVMSVLLILQYKAPEFRNLICFVLVFCIVSLVSMITYGVFFFKR